MTDRVVLAWSAQLGRVLLTHDASTMTAAAYARLASGELMPGLIVVPQWLSIGQAVDELVLIAQCGLSTDWEGQVRFLPLGWLEGVR